MSTSELYHPSIEPEPLTLELGTLAPGLETLLSERQPSPSEPQWSRSEARSLW